MDDTTFQDENCVEVLPHIYDGAIDEIITGKCLQVGQI